MSFFTPDIFLRPGLLFGAALAVVPILLHLLMRTKPKKLIFPALRLIQNRRKNNVRRLKLRHLWLLLLRIAVIVLIVLAIARPSLPAANYSLTGTETATLLGIVALAVGLYFALMTRWRKQRLPHHTLTYRRSVLRGGTGLAIALLLLLCVFWPYQRRIAAEIDAPAAELTEDLPIAAVFVFDTSLSMEYRYEGKTRLEQAQKIATDYLANLPTASRVAVGGTKADDPFAFREDLTVARGDVQSLRTSAVSVPINQRVRQALSAQEQDYGRTLDSQTAVPAENRQDQFLREIYIFTDLSETAWRKNASKLLREELDRLKFINVYVIDLSVEKPQNAMIESLKLSSQTVPLGSPLSVDVTLSATGTEEINQTVEILATNSAGKEVPQGKRTVRLKPGEPIVETFQLTDLSQPFAQGQVRLGSGDPLDADNRRYFTVGVQFPPRVLIVDGEPGDGDYLRYALAPPDWEKKGQAPFRVDQHTSKWLDTHLEELGNYQVVCLVNVPGPGETMWNALAEFTNKGGGLAIFLGSEKVSSIEYNTTTAQSLVPAELRARRPFNPPETLSLTKREHPLFKRLFELNGATEFSQLPVYECWYVKPAADASVVDWYTQIDYPAPTPAIVERADGAGRVVLLTTGVTLKKGQLNWSDLAMPSWQFLVFSHEYDEVSQPGVGGAVQLSSGGRSPGSLGPRTKRRELFVPHAGRGAAVPHGAGGAGFSHARRNPAAGTVSRAGCRSRFGFRGGFQRQRPRRGKQPQKTHHRGPQCDVRRESLPDQPEPG